MVCQRGDQIFGEVLDRGGGRLECVVPKRFTENVERILIRKHGVPAAGEFHHIQILADRLGNGQGIFLCGCCGLVHVLHYMDFAGFVNVFDNNTYRKQKDKMLLRGQKPEAISPPHDHSIKAADNPQMTQAERFTLRDGCFPSRCFYLHLCLSPPLSRRYHQIRRRRTYSLKQTEFYFRSAQMTKPKLMASSASQTTQRTGSGK